MIGTSTRQILELTSQGAAHFTAYAARAAQPGGAGIVILPGGRGLLPTYLALADRFAEAGIHAVAIDHFGRSAGLGMRDEQFDFAPHLRKTAPETTAADVASAIEYLRSDEGGSACAIFTIGFSFGGAASFFQAAEGHELAGAIGFYGWPTAPDQDFQSWPAPITRVDQFQCPVLAIFGEADTRIPQEHVRQFREALEQTAVEHQIVVYEGADHGFFDRRSDDFPKAAEQAWKDALAFIFAHTSLAMQIISARSRQIKARRGEDHFTGGVWIEDSLVGQPAGGASIHRVFFEPGARTHWHWHPGGQILFVLTGLGRVGDRCGVREISPGDLVYTPPEELH